MTIKNLLLILALLCGIAASAAKVALIPAAPELAPVADQVLVTMPNDSGIEFLERAGIEAVLKERKLTAAGLTGSNLADMSKTIHADLFAVITAKPAPKGKKEAVVSGLIVYDARNGFRLVNAAVSEQDAVKEIVERLQQAQDIIKHPEKQILLSIVTVRDAGVPEKHKYQMAFITAELDRQLSSIPGVVMLERDYLDSVNQERKITGQMFNLAPSARLLRLEFSPVDSSDKIALTVRVTDVTGKEQIRYKIDDAFNSPDNTVKNMLANLTEKLKFTQPPSATAVSRQAEAARYYEEYSLLLHHEDYDMARGKLQSAIALRPDSPEYRMAMIPLLFKYIYHLHNDLSGKKLDFSFDNKFSKAEEALQVCDEVSRDFPEYNKGIYKEMAGILRLMSFVMSCADNSSWQRMIEFADKVRPKIEAEFDPHLSGGIRSIEELESYRRYFLSTCDFYYYFDGVKFSDGILKHGLEMLRLSSDFFRRNPQLIPDDIDRQDEIIDLRFPYVMREHEKQAKYFVINSTDYIKAAKTHPLKAAKILGLTLELCQKTISSNYNDVIFRTNMQEYCRTVAALKIPHIPAHSTICYHAFLDFTGPRLLNVAEEIVTAQFSRTTSTAPTEKMLKAIMQEQNLDLFAQKVIAVVPQLKQLRPQIFTDSKIRGYPGLLANRLYYGLRQNNENCRKALEVLMDGTQITPMLSLEKLLIPGSKIEHSRIVRATWYSKMIYLLVLNSESKLPSSGRLSIISFNPEDGTAKNLTLIPSTSNLNPDRVRGFSVSENYASMINDESMLLLPLDGSPVTELKDLPGKNIRASAVLGGRVYVFTCRSSQTGSPQEAFLISCLPDGSDRKIHISSQREEKQNFLDRNPSYIWDAFTDAAKKRILFFILSPLENCGLWEFYPESGKINKLISGNSYRSVFSETRKIGKRIFFTFDGKTCMFDCRDDQYTIIHEDKNSNGFNPTTYFLMQGDRLCLLRPTLLLICPSGRMEQSPFIFLPELETSISCPDMTWINPINIFPHTDGSSVIVILDKRIYKVTLKEE